MGDVHVDDFFLQPRTLFSSSVDMEKGGEFEYQTIDGCDSIVETKAGHFIDSETITEDDRLIKDFVSIVIPLKEWKAGRNIPTINKKRLLRILSKYGAPSIIRSENGVFALPLQGVEDHIINLWLMLRLLIASDKNEDKVVRSLNVALFSHRSTMAIRAIPAVPNPDHLEKPKIEWLNYQAHVNSIKEHCSETTVRIGKETLSWNIEFAMFQLEKEITSQLSNAKLQISRKYHVLNVYVPDIYSACYLQLANLFINRGGLRICQCGGVIFGRTSKKRCDNCKRSTENNRKRRTILSRHKAGDTVPDLAKEFETSEETIHGWIKNSKM